jgi:hypothetical protein
VVYDSRERRGEGPGAALLQLHRVTSVLSQALDIMPPNMQLLDDTSLETLLGSVVTSIAFEYQWDTKAGCPELIMKKK